MKLTKILLSALLAFSLGACSLGGNNTEEVTGNEVENTDKTEQNAEKETAKSEPGTVGQTIEADGISYTLRQVTTDNLTYTYLPDQGYVFVYCLVTIRNDTDTEVKYDALDWKIQTGQGEDYTLSEAAMAGVEGALTNGTLAPDESVEGLVGFEVPEGQTLTLIHYELLTDKVLASWTLTGQPAQADPSDSVTDASDENGLLEE